MNDFDMWVRMYYEFGFSDEEIIEKITNIFDGIIRATNPELGGTKDKTEEEVITDLLSKFGIPKSVLGYRYLKDAIKYYLKNSNEQTQKISITKELYPELARLNDTKPGRIERAIRHAIELACDRCGASTIEELFGNTISWEKGKPTNSECLALFSEKVKIQLKQNKSQNQTNPIKIMVQEFRNNGLSDHQILREIGKKYGEITMVEEESKDNETISYDEKIKIISNLDHFGMPKNRKGYNYLIDSIVLYKRNPKKRIGDIYKEIGNLYECTPLSVEHAIRHAIEAGCSRCALPVFQEYFGNTEKIPNAIVFIATFAKKS